MSARILVIEDNPANTELMVYLLNAYGHTALQAYDGEEGLEKARKESPDLILCDIHLPRMDGYSVLQQLKSDATLSRIPVIAVTALAMVGDREKLLDAGFNGYIGKPIEPEVFVSQVESFLRANLHSSAHPATTPSTSVEQSLAPVWKGRILMVDDLLTNCEFIRNTLQPAGYEVIMATSAGQGMALAKETDFDLILCDLNMPDVNGLEFFRQIKVDARLQAVPFVFISATASENEKRRILQIGPVRFIRTPIDPQLLTSIIETCLLQAREH